MNKTNSISHSPKTKTISNVYGKLTTNRLQTKLTELIESSTSHGLPNIFRTKRLSIKALWTVCFLVSVSVCSYMVFSSISEYLNYEAVSRTELITETKTPFPTVTICNVNPLTTKDAEVEVERTLASLFISSNLTGMDYLSYFLMANRLVLLDSYVKRFDKSYSMDKFGFSFKDILKYCSFNELTCTHADFEWHYDLSFGNCFRFNPGRGEPLKETNKAGPNNGLVLYFILDESSNKYSSVFSEGLKVFVHNSSFEPTAAEGISIDVSKATDVTVKRTFIKREPYPYSDCVDLRDFESELLRVMAASNRTYRQEDCFDLCLQKVIVKNCSCYDLSYLKIDNSLPCLNQSQLSCAGKEYVLFRNRNIDEECVKNCPLECETMSFDVGLSSTTFPTKFLYRIFDNIFYKNLSFEDIKSRGLQLNVYYPKLSYFKLTESRKTSTVDLLSNIGGTLGLYIGISFLSLVEIVELFLEVLFAIFNFNY